MSILILIVVFTFVIGVLGVVAFALFELTPFARRSNSFRDPQTGKRVWESPHLD
jgi:hypothetical protein